MTPTPPPPAAPSDDAVPGFAPQGVWEASERRMTRMMAREVKRLAEYPEATLIAANTAITAAGRPICFADQVGILRDKARLQALLIRYLTAAMNGEDEPRESADA